MRLLKYLAAPLVPLLAAGAALAGWHAEPAAQAAARLPAIPAAYAQPAALPASAADAGRSEAADAALAALRFDLRQIVGRLNTGAQAAVLVVSLDRGDTLFALNPDVPLAPASNMKLYSTAAALYYLGPDFRYSTYVLGTGEVRDGVLEGDLVLYGTGDPSMSARMLGNSLAPLRALADTLLARGVREVRGDLIGDGSYFDDERLGRGWNPDNFGAWYSAPVGALSLAENVASVRVLPGSAPGTPARITTAPPTQGLAIVNRVTTVAGGATLIRFEYAPEGLVVSGRIARGHPGVARSLPIADPANYAAAAFRSVLEERGIRVHGGVRVVHDPQHSPVTLFRGPAQAVASDAPHPRVLAIHLSPPLAELVAVTNQVSHNLFAEALLKTVGRVALGEGTFDAGARAVRYFLECEAALDSAALGIVDGSGLSPLNRVTARTTIRLLDVMTRSPHWEAFYASLPEAGQRRPQGLQRMHGTPAERNLRAKTGTIRHVSALSGYVRTASGERLAFSIIANRLPESTWAAKRIEDQIGARLAAFERPPGALAPEPVLAAQDEASESAVPAVQDAPADPPAAPAADPEPGPAAAPPARTHRVRAGDTLDGIARRYGTSVRALEQANPGVDPRRLQLGQTIRIPD